MDAITQRRERMRVSRMVTHVFYCPWDDAWHPAGHDRDACAAALLARAGTDT